ncbi:MAG: ATP-binding protein [Kofleriaceae bacterium]|nr:ATP-binding protein [Kofleriaceae bacterium]
MTVRPEQHPLLSRLLRKVGASAEVAPSVEAWRKLLELVSRTYHEGDQDRYTLERSLDISSREMQGLYQDLKRSTETELAAQRKRIEESYAVLRATLESAFSGILVVDGEGRVIAINQRFIEMMDVPADVVAGRDYAAVLGAMMNRVVGGELVLAAEAPPETTKGDVLKLHDGRVLERRSAPVRLPDGAAVGRVTFFRDITEERAARLQLEGAWEAAEAASKAKSMFLANMSHELRTPLNAVIGLADLLLIETGDPTTKRQREYLEAIMQSGRHLLDLVNDVLDLAKLDAGKHALDLEVVAVSEALEEAVRGFIPLAHKRGVSLSIHVARGVRHLRVDRLRLRQILVNLIGNALKFTNRGGQVTISASDDGAQIALSIADTGIGIADEDLPRLFQTFEQLTAGARDRPTGTGLGLALTKRLVQLHHGTIDVVSELGAGTTFTVTLPGA